VTAAKADLEIYDIKMEPIQEGAVRIVWSTNESSTGYVFFGKTQENLPLYVGDVTLSRLHSADLTGLRKGQDCYYKITATGQNGDQAESFVNYIDTSKMLDTHGAVISNIKKLQIIDTAFALSFSTDELVKASVKYGTAANALSKTWSNSSFKQEHTAIISGLKTNTRYFFEISVKDKDNNISTNTGDVTTTNQKYNEIKISNLVPIGTNQTAIMPEAATITWNSNVLATADISYGVSPKSLNKTVKITTTASLSHKASLSKLESNTTYYYKIKMKSDLNKKSFESQIYSFKTAAMNSEYLKLYFNNGDLVKFKSITYLIYNNTKTPINNSEKVKSISLTPAKAIEEKYFKQYKDSLPYYGIFHDGQLVKEAKGSTVYLIDGKYKRPIAKWELVKALNYTSKDIAIASKTQLNAYKNGTIIKAAKEVTNNIALNNKLVKSTSGSAVYLVANGLKMVFPNQETFLKYGYSFSEIKTITDKELKNIKDGQVII